MSGRVIVFTGLRPKCVDVGVNRLISRRRFVGLGVVAGIGFRAGTVSSEANSDALPESVPVIRSYNELGRTGLKISDISFGSSQSSDPDLVRHALDRGVTYFDTA